MRYKRHFSLLLAVITLIIFAVPVSAAENKSEVYTDLSAAVLNGEKFDFADYPKDTTDTGVYLLTVNERGFDPSDMSEYGFYVYLYNPSGLALSAAEGKNKIQLATAWTDESKTASRYNKFNLDVVSVSNEEGYEYVFYKCKVGTESNGANSVESYLKDSRRYEISGIEVQRLVNTNVNEYPVGVCYEFFGTEKANNKVCQASKIDTIELEVHHTYFRSQSSAAGVNHSNQLNAVYFNVPAKYWVEYEKLYSIQCEWEEYRTTPMIVTDNTSVAAHLVTWRGRGNGSGYNSSNPLSLCTEPRTSNATGVFTMEYDWTYNTDLSDSVTLTRYSLNNCEAITWSFLSDEIELRQSDISSETVMNYWETHGETYRDRMITEEGVTDYDVEVDGVKNRKAGYQYHDIAFNDTFSMNSYSSNHGWLQQLLNYNIFNGGAGTNLKDNYRNIPAIQEVSTSHLTLRAEELAAKYYVNPTDADDFKAVVTEGMLNGMKTVVFRFAVTDYFAEEVTALINNEVADGTTYRAEQTVFIDFDVISLTFEKENDFYVIPVASSPSDFIGGISSPQVDKDSGLQYLPGYAEDAWANIQRMFMLFMSVILVFVIVFFVFAVIRPQNPVVVKINDTAKRGAEMLQGTRRNKKNKNGGKK